MNIDIDKLEELTAARKKTWQALHEAIGAHRAALEFAHDCKKAMDDACARDELANSALHKFVSAQTEPK